ncbi:unnamed protein product [Closterium sp. Naga37s-1]|nr:unnamed protein product [Closterium sp. Naga37s-1]
MLIWLIEWWGRVEVRLYGDPKDHAYYGKESALCVSNHRSDVDWAIGWVFCQRCGCLGGTRALIKEEAKWMPVIGWSMWFSEYLFIARNYATDQRRILDGYARLRSFPRFFWTALFMEGTRFTPEKLKAAQEYAKEAGLPIPRHVLVPRTKGLVMSVEQTRGHAGAIYDFTVNYPVGKPPPTFANIFKRKASQIDVYFERVPMDQIPQDAEGISKWCQESFVKKDKKLDYYVAHNGFDEKQRLNTTKCPKSILHTCFWTALNFVVYGWIFTRNLSAITFTWATLGWIAVGVAAVLAVVQRAPQGGGGPVGPVRCWPASSPGGRRTGGSCAVLASELPRGEEDRWVLCGAGQRAPQGGGGPVGPMRCWPASSPVGRRTGGSCAVLASELPRGEEDRWVLCGAGQRAPQGGGGPLGPFLASNVNGHEAPAPSAPEPPKPKEPEKPPPAQSDNSLMGLDIPAAPFELRTFKFKELHKATQAFKEPDNVLGEGGFGKVYKGFLKDWEGSKEAFPIAVKKLNPNSFQGQQEWLAEILLLGRVRHQNLVKLLGYCAENGEGMLVYEFLGKGSLDYHLFPEPKEDDPTPPTPLPWEVRLRIALDAAAGLAYLHENNVIHRDFKAPNILLDDDWSAKLTDFGLAKGADTDQTHVTTRIMGTMGYLDPKYMETGQLTRKSDVYAFGVMLLELLTGKRAMDQTQQGMPPLTAWAQQYLNQRKPDIGALVDPCLLDQFTTKAAQRAAHKLAISAKHCIEEDPNLRPLMSDMVETLRPLVAAAQEQSAAAAASAGGGGE